MKSMLTIVAVLAVLGAAFWFLTVGEEGRIALPVPNEAVTPEPELRKPATPDAISSNPVAAARYAGESGMEEAAPLDPTARGVVTARVVDASGQPLTGCTAFAAPNGGWGGPGTSPPPTTPSVKSTADGRISLPGFRIGSRYSMQIEHPKHLDATIEVLVPSDAPFDVGTVVLKPGAMLTGVVVGDDGKGIAKAAVRIAPAAPPTTGGMTFGFAGEMRRGGGKSVTTDAEGRWTAGGIADGPVKVTASSSQHLSGPAVAATAKVGQTVEVPAIRLDSGLKISGRVVDHAGVPVAGATVSFTAKSKKAEPVEGGVEASATVVMSFASPGAVESEPFVAGDGPRRSAVTGKDGTFGVAGLKEGTYAVRARRFGHAAVRIEVEAGASALEVKLGRGAVIAGHVVDADGNPLADARFKVVGGVGVFGAGLPETGATASSAEVLRGPAAAALSGLAEAPNLVAVAVGEGTVMLEASAKGGATTLFPVDGMKSGEVRQLEFRLLPESLIEGIVRDDRGEGVAGVDVVVRSPEEFGGTVVSEDAEVKRTSLRRSRMDGQPVGKAVSGAGGRFEIAGVADGTWALSARKEGYVDTTTSIVAAPRTKTSAELTLSRTGTVEGVVTAVEGVERSGRVLALTPRGKKTSPFPFDPYHEAPRAVSDATGRFTFVGVAPGDWGLEFVRGRSGEANIVSFSTMEDEDNAPPKGVPVVVKSGETTRLEIAVPKPSSVVGVVVDAGAPVAGVRVELARAGQPFFGMGNTRVTDASGRFAFEDVETGGWLVKTQPKGAPEPVETAVDVVEGAEVAVRLELPGGVIEGFVRDAAGAPVAGAKVVASRKREGGVRTAIAVAGVAMSTSGSDDDVEMITFDSTNPVYTSADGSYRIPYVVPATWSVKATSKQHRPAEKDGIDVTDGRTVKVDLVVDVGGQCSFTCEGGPFDHVNVRVLDAERGALDSAMGRKGPFLLRGLPPGTHAYEVTAFRAGVSHVARGTVEIKAGETTRLTVTPKAE